MSSKLKLSLALVAIFTIGVVWSSATHAQEEKEGIGISPTTLSLQADPGQELKRQLTVFNEGNQPIKYRLYANNFTVRNEEYEKDFENSTNSQSPSEWFSLPSGTRELAPKAQEKLDYSVTIPKDAASRGYYAVIFAETSGDKPDSSGVVRIKRVGTLVYVGVTGGLVEKGQMVEFKADSWQHQPLVKSFLRLQNDGNVHLEAGGQLELKNILGRTVSRSEIRGTVIPDKIRSFNLELPSHGFGLYKIEGTLNYSKKDTPLKSQWILVASPLWLTILCIAIIAGIVALGLWVKRHVRRKR